MGRGTARRWEFRPQGCVDLTTLLLCGCSLDEDCAVELAEAWRADARGENARPLVRHCQNIALPTDFNFVFVCFKSF